MLEQTNAGLMQAINSLIPGGITNLLNTGLGIAAIAALGTIIYAGILYSMSGDNTSVQKEAKAWVMAAIKGIAVIAFGYIILNIANPRMLNYNSNLYALIATDNIVNIIL